MKKYTLVVFALLGSFMFFACKNEDSGSSPILNDFYISSVIDKNGYYKTTTLDVGNSYYGMINITDEDKDAQSITITQTRKSDSYIIGPVTTNLPAISETTFLAYAEFTPDFTGTWDVSVFVTDSNGNKSNTLTLQVEVWESGKYIITFNGNGATSGAMEQQTLSVGEKLQANQFAKEGYLFSGWNRAKDGSDVGYGNEEEFSIKYKGNDIDYPRSVTFYAQWYELDSSLDMIFVEGGSFTMGYSGNSSYYASQYPAHTVTLDSFYMAKYEVTIGLQNCIDGASYVYSYPNRPMSSSWRNAIVFCNKLTKTLLSENDCVYFSDEECSEPYTSEDATNLTVPFMKITNKGYRLPTEAEWEYAAKGGKNKASYIYSGSDTENDVSWNSTNSNNQKHDVGLKLPNDLGIYDMSGNVAEWVWDTYAKYTTDSQTNPTGAVKTSVYDIIYRGRSYSQEGTNVFYRDYFYKALERYDSYSNTGIRLVRTKL